jgi:hypothetical protein
MGESIIGTWLVSNSILNFINQRHKDSLFLRQNKGKKR